MTLDNATHQYTLDGASPNKITMSVSSGSAAIDNNGHHEISAPLEFASNATVRVANVTDTLTVAGPLTVDSGVTLSKVGEGTLVISGPQSYAPGAVLQIGSSGVAGAPAGVPEPSAVALLAAGAASLVMKRWKNRRRM